MSVTQESASGFAMEPVVTPLIDVLLVPLLIFMAALPATRQAMTTAQLPQETRAPTPSEVGIVLEVEAGARYHVNRAPVGANAPGAHLAAIDAERRDKRLIVKGARGTKLALASAHASTES